MFSEDEGPREGLAAKAAFKWLFPSVVAHVVSVDMHMSSRYVTPCVCILYTYRKSSPPERILPIKGLEAVVTLVHTISMCPRMLFSCFAKNYQGKKLWSSKLCKMYLM